MTIKVLRKWRVSSSLSPVEAESKFQTVNRRQIRKLQTLHSGFVLPHGHLNEASKNNRLTVHTFSRWTTSGSRLHNANIRAVQIQAVFIVENLTLIFFSSKSRQVNVSRYSIFFGAGNWWKLVHFCCLQHPSTDSDFFRCVALQKKT